MIDVILRRAWEDHRVTLGMLMIKGVQHDPFFTLENPKRVTSKDSRIPAYTYKCVPFSGLKYKETYEVTHVPFRSSILFHWGNFESDTLGCILLGDSVGILAKEPAVMQSKQSFNRFRTLIGKNSFNLTIIDIGGIGHA